MYLKITNAEENHNGLQYQDGLVIDPVPFAKEGSCCPGGIYFTTPKYICNFMNMGRYVREVTIPEDAEMVKDPDGDKWRASKVVLSPRKELSKSETWKWLIEIGVDIDNFGGFVLSRACLNGHLEVVKFLAEYGIDIHAASNLPLRWACYYNQLEVMKYLLENGADIHAEEDKCLRQSSMNGRLEIVKFLIEAGADIHAQNDDAFRVACYYNQLEVVKYLVENGANIHNHYGTALLDARNYEYVELEKYLLSLHCTEPLT
jgi:ankyrin repeat protein